MAGGTDLRGDCLPVGGGDVGSDFLSNGTSSLSFDSFPTSRGGSAEGAALTWQVPCNTCLVHSAVAHCMPLGPSEDK